MELTLPTIKKTKKKFYNQYIYKITLKFPGIHSLRWHTFDQLANFCLTDEMSLESEFFEQWRNKSLHDVWKNRKEWLEFISLLDYYNTSFKKRIEGDFLDIYTNEIDLYDNICDKFSTYVVGLWKPEKGKDKKLLASTYKIFCKKLPHDRYRFRVYLKPHLLDNNLEDRKKLCKWIYSQNDKTTLSASIEKWILTSTSNYDRRYILVEDEQTILMLRLRSPNLVGKVLEYSCDK